MGAQRVKRSIYFLRPQVSGDDGLDGALVDRLRAGGIELLIVGVLVVAKEVDDLVACAWRQGELNMMGTDGRPAVGNGI